MEESERSRILHASSVAFQSRGVLILGKSGTGKSTLALKLMALGCDLVSDDRTIVTMLEDHITLQAPEAIQGAIEVRQFGILRGCTSVDADLACVVDLDQLEASRLPEVRFWTEGALNVRMFHNSATEAFPYAILQYLKNTCKTAQIGQPLNEQHI
jgi:HPr kinase/phosphorylase